MKQSTNFSQEENQFTLNRGLRYWKSNLLKQLNNRKLSDPLMPIIHRSLAWIREQEKFNKELI